MQILPSYQLKKHINKDIFFFYECEYKQFIQSDQKQLVQLKDQIYQESPNKDEETQIYISNYRKGTKTDQKIINQLINIFEGNQIIFKPKSVSASLIKGLNCFLNNHEVLYNFDQMIPLTQFDDFNSKVCFNKKYIKTQDKSMPYILVKIRSGISFFLVNGIGNFKRISGSIMGESFVESLIFQLTKYRNINQAFSDAFLKGNNKNVDMTVKDIYGEGCSFLGLPGDLIASSFGKCSKYGPVEKYQSHDIAKSLLISFAVNTGQLINLYCSLEQQYNVIVSMWKIKSDEYNFTLQSVINYYSKGKCNIHFVEDSDYLSCVGDFV
ncbi:hypothetical protein IMG5_000840 [Ichthyophthirius multifiliis]|uniref:Pantothenate kinase n=1 Tax=Ichthyophthirius multifiliis TaxID=5932 RepID=G0QIX1_ICHMU|nr:hypothetical protein IMG5_000840 [Ichthyophthirius multifiliis]EGR34856.1 hypothetical protein IMG5_000840 [Ichthyophthirius multifiliis]|eukprot:XP_004040160.1 hypothetical protein IMG5_000840 [Ichthyophthirius multifiliis]